MNDNLHLGAETLKRWAIYVAVVVWFCALILANVLEFGGFQFFCIILSIFGFVGGAMYIGKSCIDIHQALEKIEAKKNGDRYVSDMDAGEKIWAERLRRFGDWVASRKPAKTE